jgi:hypothetical protein
MHQYDAELAHGMGGDRWAEHPKIADLSSVKLGVPCVRYTSTDPT